MPADKRNSMPDRPRDVDMTDRQRAKDERLPIGYSFKNVPFVKRDIAQPRYQTSTRLIANDLDGMRSTFFDIASCISCFCGSRLSHQNVNAKRRQSALSSKLYGTSVTREVFRTCVFHLDVNEASLLEVSHSIRGRDEIGSASIF
jgi:hypothetical protein